MERLRTVVRRIPALPHALIKAWEGVQVELQGQYSPNRLDELHAFTRQTDVVRTAAIILLTPVICMATAVVLDLMPLRPPTGGIHQQSITYWLRVFFTFAVATPCIILQFQFGSPHLPFRRWPFIAAAALIAATTPVFFLSYHLLIGFPTPFAIQLVVPTGYPLLCSLMWAMWKTYIRGNTEVQRDLQQFVLLSTCLMTMLVLYPVMIFAFGKLDGIQQTLFSCAFPVLKLMFKNWASRGLYRLEDTAPVSIVVAIDVFHALLLSSAMQSAASRGTLISVMAIDVFQSVIAVAEVRAVVKRLERLHVVISMREAARTPPLQMHHHTNILSVACFFLESHLHIRNDPTVGLPRHQRQAQRRVISSMSAVWSPTRIVPVAHADPSPDFNGTQPASRKEGGNQMINSTPEVRYVRFTLKLLHMVEFYVLIEFIEVVVAVIYAIYLMAMFYLPNRAYYPSVRSFTHDQLMETVGRVLQYAALEFLSLAMLCVMLDRLLGFSTVRLLAFTLRKHVVLVQSQLTLWVFASTLLSLEHFGTRLTSALADGSVPASLTVVVAWCSGCDYTFRFAWLRHPVEQNVPPGDRAPAT